MSPVSISPPHHSHRTKVVFHDALFLLLQKDQFSLSRISSILYNSLTSPSNNNSHLTLVFLVLSNYGLMFSSSTLSSTLLMYLLWHLSHTLLTTRSLSINYCKKFWAYLGFFMSYIHAFWWVGWGYWTDLKMKAKVFKCVKWWWMKMSYTPIIISSLLPS